ncbi:MAG: hypothetical protein R3268_02345 [Acidiferrobacterales bacterium]|nr:hypothetical protein [Acidiferrobacterales bacterium]
MLIDLKTFRETYFCETSRPSMNTVRSWMRRGEIPYQAVTRIGRKFFIDTEKLPQGVKPTRMVA